MNLYLAVSEEIFHVEWEDWFNQVGHREDYRIAELVVARSHGHARWLAWKSDKYDSGYPTLADMPKFAVRLKEEGVAGPARIATEQYEFAREMYAGLGADTSLWYQDLWDVGKAPHIGIGGG